MLHIHTYIPYHTIQNNTQTQTPTPTQTQTPLTPNPWTLRERHAPQKFDQSCVGILVKERDVIRRVLGKREMSRGREAAEEEEVEEEEEEEELSDLIKDLGRGVI